MAAELLDGSGDGVWLVELAAVSDPDAVPSVIIEALGIAPQAGRSALEALLDALGPQDLLIVLDNCEHPWINTCAKTANALVRRCPRVHLVATSREPLAADAAGDVDWSYSLLNGAEQALLRRLSVFAETFDLDAAEAVCGFGDIAVFDVAELLGALVDKSLVVAEPAGGALRYRQLETIRQFAAERLAEAGEDEAAAEAAHCQHYLSVAEAAAPHLREPTRATGSLGWTPIR